jgi:hypothetical protein
MTAFGTIETAVRAVKEGAYDFLTKPFDTDHLLLLLKRALDANRVATQNILLRSELGDRIGLPKIIGRSKQLQEITTNIQKVAPTNATVLIHGESGTGKELFARAIHFLSTRKDAPFVAINSAAIPRELLESELFGYERGPLRRGLGLGARARTKTVFLDEIWRYGPGAPGEDLPRSEQVIERVWAGKADQDRRPASSRRRTRTLPRRRAKHSGGPVLPPERLSDHHRAARERRDDIRRSQHFLTKYSTEVKGPLDRRCRGDPEVPWKGVREPGT